jgi:predicted acylesterase/phospholipase RssA
MPGARVRPHRPFALVLGGGGARGFAHLGILRALELGQLVLADGAYTDLAPVDVDRKLESATVIAVDAGRLDRAGEIRNGFQALVRAVDSAIASMRTCGWPRRIWSSARPSIAASTRWNSARGGRASRPASGRSAPNVRPSTRCCCCLPNPDHALMSVEPAVCRRAGAAAHEDTFTPVSRPAHGGDTIFPVHPPRGPHPSVRRDG